MKDLTIQAAFSSGIGASGGRRELPAAPVLYGAGAAAVELFEQTLENVPTLFGRLLYVAAFRGSPGYHHNMLSHSLSPETTTAVLARIHLRTFVAWLELSLRQQRGDMNRFFSAGDRGNRAIISTIRDEGLFDSLIPASANPIERDLFSSDIVLTVQAVLEDR